MHRRALLLGSGCLALLGVSSFRYLHASDEDAIVAVLRRCLGYLRLDDDGVRRFAHDYAAAHLISTAKLRALDAVGPLYSHLPFNSRTLLPRDMRRGEERVVTKFLLSSDFFAHGADMTRTVRYVGLFDPLRGCGNPFARAVGGTVSA